MNNFVNIESEELKRNQVEEFFIPKSFTDKPRKYRHATYLGSGGYGVVVGLGVSQCKTNVAVKKYLTPFQTARRAQRCFREIQLLSQLKHENIVEKVLAYSTNGSMQSLETVYLTTKYCGRNLTELLKEETLSKHRFDLKSFKRMLSELLRALKYLNSVNVIHRDVKPPNLAIDETGKLTLIDFGLARVLEGADALMTGEPGTKYYRAIETIVFGGANRSEYACYNENADIWSIGAILCEMITGEILFLAKPPAKDIPMYKAIEICGPIPDKVLRRIDDLPSQNCLKNRPTKGPIDFLLKFQTEGRSWLRVDIKKDSEAILDFINRTLHFDHETRMSVDEALSHHFLANTREEKKEVIAGPEVKDTICDVVVDGHPAAQAIERWKEHIWELVKPSGSNLY